MLTQGNVSALRAAYEARWHSFGLAVKAGGRHLTYAEMPWPAEGAEDVRTVILYGTSTPAEVSTSPTRPRHLPVADTRELRLYGSC